MKRLAALIAATMVGLGGCASSPDLSPIRESLKPAVLAVPGVTGGVVSVSYQGLSPGIQCRLTGQGATATELLPTFEAVLRTVVAKTTELSDADVACHLSNGGTVVSLADVGLTDPTSLTKLRRTYG